MRAADKGDADRAIKPDRRHFDRSDHDHVPIATGSLGVEAE